MSIKDFCENPTIEVFNNFSQEIKEVLINNCYYVLYQKTGDKNKAIKILRAINEIETINDYIIYKGNFKLKDKIKK